MSARCSFAAPAVLRSLKVANAGRLAHQCRRAGQRRCVCVASEKPVGSSSDPVDKNKAVLNRICAGEVPVRARYGRSTVIHVDAEEAAAVAVCSRKSRITLTVAKTLANALVRLSALPERKHGRRSTPNSDRIDQPDVRIVAQKYILAVSHGTVVAPTARDWLAKNNFMLEFCAPNTDVDESSDLSPDSGRNARKKATTVPSSFRQKFRHGSDFETDFRLAAPYKPCGDQPLAIETLVAGLSGPQPHAVLESSEREASTINDGRSRFSSSELPRLRTEKPRRFMTLAGVTGSGKSFICANVIARLGKPALVLAPNKILAAQLCDELRQYLPYNAVNYFVSYYSYFQPESYLPASDTFIAKSSVIDRDIDRLRHLATRCLVERRDVVVVASVSCIYGLGLPADYLRAAESFDIDGYVEGGASGLGDRLKEMRYVEVEDGVCLERGQFSVKELDDKSCSITIGPPWEKDGFCYRLRVQDKHILLLEVVGETTEQCTRRVERLVLYPASHFVSSPERLEKAIECIQQEKEKTVQDFQREGKNLEAQRIDERVSADLDMLRRVGYCSGIENYTMHISGRNRGEPPDTLLDFFPNDGNWILFIDESHVTIPQLGAMFNGNLARKNQLVKYGFRLPSAVENRPLSFDEFWEKVPQAVFISATPGKFELENSFHCASCGDVAAEPDGLDRGVVEAVIRPTGIVDPRVDIVPTKGQMDHLMTEVARTVARGERALITTLTKKDAEELAAYIGAQEPLNGLLNRRLSATFLHSGIDSVGRMEILDAVRGNVGTEDMHSASQMCEADVLDSEKRQAVDVLCGVNLLREGISLPCVSLVAVLDADKEGFLRSSTALIQTIGRAARNVNGRVILYADKVTAAMKHAVDETNRRRKIQLRYNSKHNVVPTTILAATELRKQQVETLLNQIRRAAQESGRPRRTRDTSREKLVSRSLRHFDRDELKTYDEVELRKRMDAAIQNEDFEIAAAVRDMLGL